MSNESDVPSITVNNAGGLDCAAIVQEDNSSCFSHFNDNNHVPSELTVLIHDIASAMC